MTDESNDSLLKKIIKQLSKKQPYVKIGIIGQEAVASRQEGNTNLEIGMHHEFGAPRANIPMRSFLRVPLMDNLADGISKIEKQKKLDVLSYMEKVGAIAKAIVQKGFVNNGYGKWAPTNKQAIRIMSGEEKFGNALVDTGQLRDSINYEVVNVDS